MATAKTIKNKLVKTSSEIAKLLKSKRKNATELCITLAKDLVGRMGEDKLKEKLDDNMGFFETQNYFDVTETVKDVPTAWMTTAVSKTGITANDGDNDAEFEWKELETETIINLADVLSDIHEEMQNHI